MSAVATGQMSAVETRQMTSAETNQMSTGETGHCPVSLFYICFVTAEDICLVSTTDVCRVLSEDICPVSTANVSSDRLLQAQTSVLSKHTMLMSQKSQLWQYHNAQVSERRSGLKSAANVPKWVQNGRQDSRIQPNESYGHFRPFGTSPAAKNLSKKSRNARLACFQRRPLSSTPQDLFGVSRWGHSSTFLEPMCCNYYIPGRM